MQCNGKLRGITELTANMILEQPVAVAGMDLIMKTSEMFPKKGFNGPSFEDVNMAAGWQTASKI